MSDADAAPLLSVAARPERSHAARMAIAAAIMVVVELIFAVYAYLTSHALSGSTLSPLVFAWLRDVFATVLLLSAAYVSELQRPEPEQRFWPAEAHWLRLLLCGTLGVWGSQGMSALALAHLDATTFALLQPLMPIFTVAVGTLSGVEPPLVLRACTTWAKVVGLCVAVFGAIFVVANGQETSKSNTTVSFIGITFACMQLLTGSSYPVAQKALLSHYSPLVVASWCYAAGLLVLSLSVATGAASPSDWTVNAKAAGAIAFAGVFGSAVAYGLMAWANALVGPVLLIVFFPLLPLFTAILVWIIDGKLISIGAIFGGLLIVVGLMFIVWSKFSELSAQAKAEAEAEIEATICYGLRASGAALDGEETKGGGL
jgi:drug/metabolite transporter (DMT)-like permease